MTVGDLIARLSCATPDRGAIGLTDAVRQQTVTAVAHDSRRIRKRGAIFVAVKGQQFDGVQFAPDAVARGAAIVVASGDQPDGVQVPWLTVTDSRLALAELSAAFNGDPSQELTVVGVTGTNGKTTTTYLLASIFEAAGKPCGRIGSVGYYTGAGEKTAQWTTPEAPDVQALLREMVDHRCAACAVEVSSHALAMRRVDGTRFAAGVFSNLTRDHLDYHLDMEHYFSTKQRLFDMLEKAAPAVINIDDPYGMRLASVAGRPVTYSLNGSADVTLDRLESTMDGSSLDIVSPRGRCRVRTRLPGRLNVYNVLAAVAAAVALDVPLEAIEVGVAGLEGVPGRFETVSSPADDVRVIVDFAHTDDALRAMLTAVRELCDGRVITVFGCGGDRDTAKRPLMGAVAVRLSDLVVVTSDNPRSEDPDHIIAEICLGMESAGDASHPFHVGIADRSAAIEYAIQQAECGDAVVLAGKGHETLQIIGNERRPFNDRLVAQAALARRRCGVMS